MIKNENYSTLFYKTQIEKLSAELNIYTLRSKMWVFVRLLVFLSIALSFYFTFPYTIYATLFIVTQIVLFLFFVGKSVENKEKINFTRLCIESNENEIRASHQDYSGFNNGKVYIDRQHPFSYDMDLFGEGCFFPLFNRTVTKRGEQALVDRLLNGIEHPVKSAESIDELTEKKEWYQGFLAYGKMLEKEESEVVVSAIAQKEISIQSWYKVARILIPVLALLLTGAFYYEMISGLQFIVGALVLMLPVRQVLKKTNRLHQALSKIGKRVFAVRNQLEIMEKEQFTSDLLSGFYQHLFKEDKNGKEGLMALSKLVKQAEYRNNILVAILLNLYAAWDFRLLLKFNKWKNEYGNHVASWEEILFELEVLISGANFRYNYKAHTVVPTITTSENHAINLVNIGHPIIPTSKLVKNSFSLNAKEQFSIITGPNMAGKSTFLRSIGINLMLARAGFHVMAEEFVFPDMKLYSSMRTSDELKEETSYFHAELLRLRFIMDAIERGEEVFIILDEILKGTNSKDKEEGSLKFIQKLNTLKVKGIIATHDLSLTNLAKDHPEIVNKYFDTEITGDDISFDYCMRDGVAKNMNASFLLRKMGLIDN